MASILSRPQCVKVNNKGAQASNYCSLEIWVNIGLGNDVLPAAIIWTNTDLSSMRPIGIYLTAISQTLL